MNSRMKLPLVASIALVSAGLSAGLQAQQPGMTFFVTSVGSGKGAALVGLAGADRHCQSLAKAAGAGNRTWHAYLSASASGGGAGGHAPGCIRGGPGGKAQR